MADNHTRLSPQFNIYVALPIIIAALGVMWWLYTVLQWLQKTLPSFWAHNWIPIVIVGSVLLLGGTSHKWVPKLWGAHRALDLHKQEKLDREAQRKLIEAATVKLGEGFNTKYANSKTGDLLEVVNPYVAKMARQAVAEIAEVKDEQKQLPPPAIPEKVAYEAVAQQVPRGHALLGVDGLGVKTCEFGKILTCLILGGSGTGKSNTVSIKVEEAVKDGWRLIVIDPHRRKPDSLYNRIKEYSDCFIRFDWLPDGVASEDEQIKAVLKWFDNEYKHRLQTGDQSLGDVLLICDEVGYVADLDDEETVKLLKRIAKVCGNESRGFGMAGWFINQNATGIAWLRKVVMTVITHKLNMMSERRIACNENEALARNMDKWPKHGRVYVYGLSFEETYELQMPYKQEARVVEAVPAGGNFYSAPTQKLMEQRPSHVYTPRPWEAAVNVMETPAETLVETASEANSKIIDGVFNPEGDSSSSEKNFSGVSPEIRETVRRLNNIGKLSHRDIAASVGLSGRNYHLYQQTCRELGIVISQAKGE